MRYAAIREMDITNGDGIGVSIFFQGCRFRCKGCFNPETWDLKGGKPFNKTIANKLFELCNKDYINHLSILGGEPLIDENLDDLLLLCEDFKEQFPYKKIWLWTGYTLDAIKKDKRKKKIANFVDYLITGRYEEDKKVLNKLYGSSNQRIWINADGNGDFKLWE